MKRITTTIIICLCVLLLCGCGAGREWIAAGTEDMPAAALKAWINSRGELGSMEYVVNDNGVNKTYTYKLAEGTVKQAGADNTQSFSAADMPLTVKQLAEIYDDIAAWAPGNMEDSAAPGLAISYMPPRFFTADGMDFDGAAYAYSLSARKIAPVDGEYAGTKEYGIMCGGYPQAFIFIDK